MKVEQLMSRTVQACRENESLNDAARIMWEADCGCVPVLAAGDETGRVVGMLTDRDISMAAYFNGRPLVEIPVGSAMSRTVASCRTSDSIVVALRVMETNQIHRLPVLSADDQLIGIISLADLARLAKVEHGHGRPAVGDVQIAQAIERISEPRAPRAVAVAA